MAKELRVPGRIEGDDDASAVVGEPAVVRSVYDELPVVSYATEGPDHRIVATNGMFRAYVGRDRIIGMAVREAFPESLGQQIESIFDQVLASGEQVYLRGFRVQLTRQDTGEPIEVYTDQRFHPRHGPQGEVIGTIVDVVDVTEQVREQQAALRQAVEAERRYEQARDVITALQRELLPAGLPVLPRVRIAASYLLADADTAAGGDWYDAVPLPDGRVALVVGDVVGHGVAASATMGRLQTLLHEHLVAGGDIVGALTALDAAATRIRGARAATVCVVVLDQVSGAVEYCTAGHPPPLILTRAGDYRYLAATGAGPVGVGGRFTKETVGADRLDDDEIVLLYTDGILERPGRDLPGSTVELAQTATAVAADRAFRDDTSTATERVCTQTLELMIRLTGHSDDITLLAGQRVAAPADLDLHLSSTAGSLVSIRESLASWLSEAGVGEQDAGALRHAVVELVTNVIDHAYLDMPDVFAYQVAVSLTDAGELHATVTDHGRWRTPVPSADRGLGLHLTEAMVDTLNITHDENGTTAAVTLRVSTPARLLDAADLSARPGPEPSRQADPFLLFEQPSAPGPRVRVDGPIDAATVDEFDRLARQAGVTGSRSLTMDLTGVTHLASAGVAALHRLRTLHGDNHTELRLYAPAGSPADMILSLTQIPHDIHDPDHADEPAS